MKSIKKDMPLVEPVTVMQRAGIINGVGGSRFAPKDGADRAQAAVIIYRLFSIYNFF